MIAYQSPQSTNLLQMWPSRLSPARQRQAETSFIFNNYVEFSKAVIFMRRTTRKTFQAGNKIQSNEYIGHDLYSAEY